MVVTRPSSRATAAGVARRLAAEGVEAVALAVVDVAGITRVKTIPIRRFAEVARSGVGLSNVFSVFMADDTIASSPGINGPTGDTRLVPDPSATVRLDAMPGWALAPVDQMQQDGASWPACGRAFAARQLSRLGEHGLELRGAYELEFFLGRRSRVGIGEVEPDPLPGHTGPGYGAAVLDEQEPFATALIRALESQGTGVMQYHPEYSTGQFELSIPHVSGIGIADSTLVARQTVRAAARTNGLDVSFSPVVFAGLVGNGYHLHFSVWDRKGHNLFAGGRGPEGMRRKAEMFAAGVLAELPALVAVSCPSPVSYQRLKPHRWAGAFACWGRENREAGMRFVTGMRGLEESEANMEIKAIDAAGNPYLVLGAVVAAGLAGLDGELTLPEPTTDDPAEMSAARRRRMRIRPLPASLGEAITALEGSTVLREAMGEVLFDAFLASRRGEWERYRGMDDEAVVRAFRWRY
jgi:glutamine synthetase